MPYSNPTNPSQQSSQRPAYSRSRSSGTYFSDERGPGTFAPLPSLPKRRPSTTPPKKAPVFHFSQDSAEDEDGSPHSNDDNDHDSVPPTLKRQSKNNFSLSLHTKDLHPTFQAISHLS